MSSDCRGPAPRQQQRVPPEQLRRRPRRHGALPNLHGSYQVLKALALSLGGEFRRHGDNFSISDDYCPGMVKTHCQPNSQAP